MDNFEDKTIIAPTTPHNRGYENASPPPQDPPQNNFSGKIEYLKGLSLLFKDPNAKNNLLIGFVFMIIPIVGSIAVQGWYCEIMQRLLRKHPNPVPKLQFSDFGHYISRGLMPFLVGLVGGVAMAFLVGVVAFIGIFIAGLLMYANEWLGFFATLGVYLLIFVVQFLVSVILCIPVTFAEISENFAKSFDFKKIKAVLKMTWSKYAVGLFLIVLIAFPLYFAGLLLCGMGVYLSIFILLFMGFYLRAQIYQYYLSQGGEPVEMKPAQVIPSEQNVARSPA